MATVQRSVVPPSPVQAYGSQASVGGSPVAVLRAPAGRPRVPAGRDPGRRASGGTGRGGVAGVPRPARRNGVRPAGRPVRPAGAAGARSVRGGGCAANRPAAAGAGRESWDRPPLRLTRRGRRVVAGLSIAIGLAVAVVTAAVVGSEPGSALRLAGVATVVVEPGDTLWAIAVDAAPEEDPRGVVDAIRDLNGLDGVALEPGQVLQLP